MKLTTSKGNFMDSHVEELHLRYLPDAKVFITFLDGLPYAYVRMSPTQWLKVWPYHSQLLEAGMAEFTALEAFAEVNFPIEVK